MDKVYTSPMKSFLTRNGFTPVSNLLLDYQKELGLTKPELIFLIEIMRNRPGFAIHDEDLDSSVSSKTLSRRRQALKEKGIMNYSIVKKQDPATGKFTTEGISYDLTPLEEKLQSISDKIEENRQKEAEKIIKKEKITIEAPEEESTPLDDYKNDYFACYGIEYVPNEYELKKYNALSENNKKLLSYIFKYCQENGLIGKIVPRLSLFFKTAFRFADLRKYCINNGYIIDDTTFKTQIDERADKECDENEKMNKMANTKAKQIYVEYFPGDFSCSENFSFFKAIERIVGKYMDSNGNVKEIAYKFIERAFDKAIEEEKEIYEKY